MSFRLPLTVRDVSPVDFDPRAWARVGLWTKRNERVDRAVSLWGIGDSDQFVFARWLECKLEGEVMWCEHVLFGGEVVAGGTRDGNPGEPMIHVRKSGLSY